MPVSVVRRVAFAVLCVAVLVPAACGGENDKRSTRSTATAPSSSVAPTGPTTVPGSPVSVPLGEVSLRLSRVATFKQPLAMAVRSGDNAIYIAEQTGRVRALQAGKVNPGAVLDISGEITSDGEQGLLGLTFSPDGALLYVNFTDRRGDTHVVEYAMRGERADPASRRELLFVDQPYPNHNGGNLVFGPDGYLYIGLGDGGGGGDPKGNAQSLRTLLGKLLRIDPRPSAGLPYTVPSDNPFVGRDDARPEIWAYGLRNPWRFSFDRATGDLWIGDVGQNDYEEIDYAPRASKGGENYGWDRLEGNERFEGSPPANHVRPVFVYKNGDGNCAVTGGFVYRGSQIPSLRGAYVFGDFCAGKLRALRLGPSGVTEERSFDLQVEQLSSFGEDEAKELYALSLAGDIFSIGPEE